MENKKSISIKIDVEDLDYLKSNCDKYQRKIQQLIKKWIVSDQLEKGTFWELPPHLKIYEKEMVVDWGNGGIVYEKKEFDEMQTKNSAVAK